MATTADIERLLERQADTICIRVKNETIKLIDERLSEMKEDIEKVNEQVKVNCEKLSDVEKKNYQLDLVTRKKNVLMFNVSEDAAGETNLQDKVLSLLNAGTNSGLSETDVDVIHRVGKKSSKIRPIMIKFTSERAKKLVMQNVKNFIAKKISICDGVPKELSDLRKMLNPLVAKLRKQKSIFQ